MNRLQISRQVQYLLRQATWADGGLVFASDSVLVTMGLSMKAMREKRLPLALIRVGTATPDPDMDEQPGVQGVEITISVVVRHEQDQFGEVALLGANRVAGSDGRGLFEVEEKVQSALLQIGPASGLPIVFRGTGAAQATLDEGLGYIVACDYRFRALGTIARTYQAPSGFSGSSGATLALTWNAAVRWDARRFILRRASGSTAPATSASGTGVTLGGSPDGAGVTSKTDSPGSGTWSYSLFAVYDDTDAGADGTVSDAQTLTGLVVP